MNNRIRAILEDYDSLLDMHEEYIDAVDLDDIEVRALWEQVEGDLARLSRRISKLKKRRDPQDGDLEEVELQIEDLNDLYGELAALSWGGRALAG